MSVAATVSDRLAARLLFALSIFMRLLAIGWLAAGLVEWARLIGLLPLAGTSFTEAPFSLQLLTAVFALLNLLVAVGLWLLAAWGAIVWGAAVALQAASEAVAGSAGAFPQEVIALNVATLIAYVGASLIVVRRRRAARD